MDILKLSKNGWNNIGSVIASPTFKQEKYMQVFDDFCKKLPENASVLDLGCATGLPFTKSLIEYGFSVMGIDISDVMIEHAKTNVPDAEFLCMSMTDIDFENRFDGVFAGYSMLCLDPPNFAIAAGKAVRALKHKGLFLLSVNEPPEGHLESQNICEILGHTVYSRPYTEDELRQLFSNLGMSFVSVVRETVSSPEYGDENTLIVLMQKH